ncbi:MAG: UDP-N-acetylmuramate--L-alanine ligase [Bacteroidetes bacterium]|nr:MAG: UDP-N-acetylmuramate--L-alanine ligase [Bacteroidota bacterium]
MKNPRIAYFLGVGGAGMSALARYYLKEGVKVYGYDKTETALTETLIEEGVSITYDDSIHSIPKEIGVEIGELLLVITPAIPSNHPHLLELIKIGHTPIKRAEILGRITQSRPTLAIAGTHGKTTTTAILAHIMAGTSKGCNAFIGGIAASIKSNLYWSEHAEWTIVEADEFDRSFHALHPTHAVITSLDPDHLDIYGDENSFIKAFKIFSSQVKDIAIVHHEIFNHFKDLKNIETYGIKVGDKEITHFPSEIKRIDVGYEFTLNLSNGEEVVEKITTNMMGLHNLENTIAAAALAHKAGVSSNIIKERIATFEGIYRRFQIHIKTEKRVYIDDYAHHPTELKKTIQAVREHFPGRHLTVIFQPHLFSRTKDQEEGFCKELRKVDRLILLPIYAARENPMPGFNTQSLFEKISHPHANTSTINSIFDTLKAHPVDVLLSVGAGDIDLLVSDLKKWTSMDA